MSEALTAEDFDRLLDLADGETEQDILCRRVVGEYLLARARGDHWRIEESRLRVALTEIASGRLSANAAAELASNVLAVVRA